MKCEFIYSQYYDLLFHVMAHLKVNNVSDLCDEDYIAKMEEEKQDFTYDIIPAIYPLQLYYNENFERLMLINFLPYYCNSYEEMKNLFLTTNRFTQDDIRYFIHPFIKILDNESRFFFEYWDRLHRKYEPSRRSIEKHFQKNLEKYRHIFEYYNKPCKILFSYTITRNGRGFYDDSYFSALIRFPKNETFFDFSFIQLFHEYTHSITDSLLNKNITMKDDSHNLSEYVVLLADYYLIKSIDPKFIPTYLKWVKNEISEELDETKFLSIFNIDETLKAELVKLINSILTSHSK